MEVSLMLQNNNQRLNIWLSQENRFDYKEFATACIQQSVPVLSINEFAQKTGMISVAMAEYPDLQPAEAYLELIKRMNSEQGNNQQPVNSNTQQKQGCSGCGKKIQDGGIVV